MTATIQHTSAGARRHRLAGPVVTLAAVLASWAAVAVLRPGDAGPSPCPWRSLTGLDCPLCGATRAASSLAHGDLIAALDHNAYFVLVLLPLAGLAWLAWARRSWRGGPAPSVANRTLLVLLGVTSAWWLLRLAVPWLGSSVG